MRKNDDVISRQAAIDAICEHGTDLERRGITVLAVANHKQATVDLLENLPSVQPKQNEMIKEIRRWINSGNRGNADYFIVDRIEEIINKYE